MRGEWYAPLDPDCPVAEEYYRMHDEDPISQTCGCLDEIFAHWEAKHRRECKRCQEYGLENIDVVYS